MIGNPRRLAKALLSLSFAVPAALVAQQAKPVPVPRLTEAQQVASAVLALPVQFRGNARVLGYKPGGKELVPLRDTKGEFTCLATEPDAPLHLACYHNSLEPFMARGRQLRAGGVKDPVGRYDSVRRSHVGQARHAEAAGGAVPVVRRNV